MAKATMVEWLRVKKYLRPGSRPAHSSRSDSCTNPAAFSRRFASSSPDGSNSPTESTQIYPRGKKRKGEQMKCTNGVKGGGRRVEEVDEVGDDGGDGCHGRWRRCRPAGEQRTNTDGSAVVLRNFQTKGRSRLALSHLLI